MAHRSLFRFALVFVLTTSLVKSQRLFQSPIRPLYFVHRAGDGDDGRNPSNPHLPRESAYRRSDEELVPKARSDIAPDSSEEDQDDAGSSEAAPAPRRNTTTLPRNFDEVVRANGPQDDDGPRGPLYGDPAVMEEDEDEHERSRFLWPFQTSVTITKQKRGPPHHHHHPPPHHHLSFEEEFADFLEPEKPTPRPPHPDHDFDPDNDPEVQKLRIEIYRQKQRKKKWKKIIKHELAEVGAQNHAPGFPNPPLLPPHLTQQHHSPHDLEYEKTRLKYEIYKLKAKKTIAILQNKVELKKILSLLLQQKIKALEWITWYHDYVEQMFNQANGNGNGWGWGDEGDGWGESKYLTDEEIVHTKDQAEGRKSSYSWSSLFGGGLLSQLRTSLNLDDSGEKNSQAPVPITIQPIFPSSQQSDDSHVVYDNDPNVQAKPLMIYSTNNNNNNNNRKPFYYSIFSNPLLKYLGYQKDGVISSPAPSPNQLRHDIPTQHNNSPPPPPPPRPDSSEDSDENARSSREGPSEDDDDNNDEDDAGNDDEYDGKDNNSDGPDEDDDAKSNENKRNFEENPEEEQEDEEEDDKQEEEPEEEGQKEDDEEDEDKPEEEVQKPLKVTKTKLKRIKNPSQEEDTAAAGADIISEEHKDEDDAEDEEEDEEDDKLNIDIDKELEDIPLPGQHGRRPPPPSNSLRDKLFRTGVKAPPTPTPRPTSSDKKKASLKKKVYTFLFKTMDVFDKKYMTGGDAEAEELLEARNLKPDQKQEEKTKQEVKQ